jgi:chromosome partitioning protein
MERIAMTNQKGGVGKTTNAINLCGALNAQGYDVLGADLDPQGWFTLRLGLREEYETNDTNLYDGLEEPRQVAVDELIVEHAEFDVLPANLDMFALEQDLIASGWKPRERLKMLLEDLERYDVLVVDAPPSLGPINDSVILATEQIVIPVKADRLSQLAIDHLLNQIETLEERYRTTIGVGGVIVSDVDYPLDNAQDDAIAWFKETFANCPVVEVRHRVAIERTLDRGCSIFGGDAEETDQREPYLTLAEALMEATDD